MNTTRAIENMSDHPRDDIQPMSPASGLDADLECQLAALPPLMKKKHVAFLTDESITTVNRLITRGDYRCVDVGDHTKRIVTADVIKRIRGRGAASPATQNLKNQKTRSTATDKP